MSKNKTDVYICNKKYTLESDESSEFIMGVARVVDKKYQEIFGNDEGISLLDAAVLVSLESASENVKMAKTIDSMRSQTKLATDESRELRSKVATLSKQLEEVMDKNKKLQAEIDIYRLKSTII